MMSSKYLSIRYKRTIIKITVVNSKEYDNGIWAGLFLYKCKTFNYCEIRSQNGL
jgi:hypothetical protein